MSIFAKGDFQIKDTWADEKEKSKDTPKGLSKNSILVNAAKNSFEPTYHILDDKVSKRVLNQFSIEGPIQRFQSNNNLDARTPSRGSEKGQRKVSSKQPISSKNIALPPKQKVEKTDKNDDLVSSMAARLSKLEQTCKAQRLEIKEKNEQAEKLKQENQFMRKMKNSPEVGLKQMVSLKEQNEILSKKVQQMEVFLKSYGLKWVGNKMQGKLDKDKLKKDMEKPKYNYHLPSEVDINTVARRIQQLNMGLHQEGVSSNEIYKDPNGMHRFRASEPVLIGFFKEGIAIQGFKFFPYKSKQSIQILGDILDGYFPYVMKTKFPNGTFLKVVDKIDFEYNSEQQGKGAIHTFQTAQDKLLQPMSKEQFLNKLPKSITKNGKIIQVRTAIENKLDGKKDTPPIIQQQQENQYYQQDSEGVIVFKTPDVTEDQSCSLKIRTQTGQICLLKLNSRSKMNQVYKWMKYVSKSKIGFKVLSNYPKREYSQKQQQTLEELGLAPNSVLHLELLK